VLTDSKIPNGQVGQPSWKCRIDVELVVRSIGQESQKRLRQQESRAGRPGLWHVRADILYGEIRVIALKRRVEFRQLVQQEMARSLADVVSNLGCLRSEAVILET